MSIQTYQTKAINKKKQKNHNYAERKNFIYSSNALKTHSIKRETNRGENEKKISKRREL